MYDVRQCYSKCTQHCYLCKGKVLQQRTDIINPCSQKLILEYSLRLLKKGDMDNKTGCNYKEFQEETHPCQKKNLRDQEQEKPCPHVQINTNDNIQKTIF